MICGWETLALDTPTTALVGTWKVLSQPLNPDFDITYEPDATARDLETWWAYNDPDQTDQTECK